MTKIIVFLINVYQKIPLKSHFACRFIPTCSEYTRQAVLKYGPFKGLWRGFLRVCRCHPWQRNHYDPV
jgi:hypothetical protein